MIDDYPGKPKILFIGLENSSHTHNWIRLLDGMEINVRLFPSKIRILPKYWKIQTNYITTESSNNIHQYQNIFFSAYPQEVAHYDPLMIIRYGRSLVDGLFNILQPSINRSARPNFFQELLARIINRWKPDIIHTLGLFDGQGGEFYYDTTKNFNLRHKGKWVLQLRGGSDLTLRRRDPDIAKKIKNVCSDAHQIISDNIINFQFLEDMGVDPGKFASIAPIPGTGGVDIKAMQSAVHGLPSQRERIILYPKAYDCIWSKALPVFEAIKLVWDRIKPCKIIMTSAIEETFMWFRMLPEEIQNHCEIHTRIPHQDLLPIVSQARVLLAPSLVDGIPNSLYEAMACGTFPIVSPLETIETIVENEKNVLFARNLYPNEIAEAMIRAMSDDQLINTAAKNNLEIVKQYADREVNREKIQKYYQELFEMKLG